MKDGFDEIVVRARMRMLSQYRSEVHANQRHPDGRMGAFGRGMIAGLRLALLQVRWLHREIRRRTEQGYRLVWLTKEEQELLGTFNP